MVVQLTATATAQVYIDGVLGCASAPGSAPFQTPSARTISYLGSTHLPARATEGMFSGAFASFHVWTETLTAWQVKTLAGALPATVQPPLALTAYASSPEALVDASVAVFKGLLWSFGGVSSDGSVVNTFRYFDGVGWAQWDVGAGYSPSPLVPSARAGAITVVHNDMLYLVRRIFQLSICVSML